MGVHATTVYSEACEVHTYQRGKTVWIASGTFDGRPIQQKGRSERVALRNWVDVAEARYRRN